MKYLALTLLIFSQSLFAGDLGGGGSMGLMATSELVDTITIQDLKKSRNLNEAYHKWIDTLTEKQRRQVFEQTFEDYIVPELNK